MVVTFSKELQYQILQEYAAGVSARKLSRKYGYADTTILRWAAHAKLRRVVAKPPPPAKGSGVIAGRVYHKGSRWDVDTEVTGGLL